MSDADQEDVYIPVEEVAALLGVTIRSANRYATKVRTQRAGQRILYHLDDIKEIARTRGIEQEAREKGTSYKPPPKHPSTDLLPAGELLAALTDTQRRLEQAVLEVGRLQGRLEAQPRLFEDYQVAQQRISELEAEVKRLKREAAEQSRPWWRRLSRRD